MEIEKIFERNENANENKTITISGKHSEKKNLSLFPHLIQIHIYFKLMKKKIS